MPSVLGISQNKIRSIYHRKVIHREEKTEFSLKGRVEVSRLTQRMECYSRLQEHCVQS